MCCIETASYLQNRFPIEDTAVTLFLAVHALTRSGFAARNGARSEAVKVALLVVDRPSSNQDAVRREIAKVHRANIKLITIGVGDDVNDDELAELAANGGSIVRTESFAELPLIQLNLVQHICTGLYSTLSIWLRSCSLKHCYFV